MDSCGELSLLESKPFLLFFNGQCINGLCILACCGVVEGILFDHLPLPIIGRAASLKCGGYFRGVLSHFSTSRSVFLFETHNQFRPPTIALGDTATGCLVGKLIQ